MKSKVLVLVHPGSCCGSADFNLGEDIAASCRDDLVSLLDGWTGGIVVIDGTLSDELADYADLDEAIDDVVARASARGDVSVRILGSDDMDFNQVSAIGAVVSDLSLSPDAVEMELTGAWYDDEDEEGCVNSVYDRLEELGFSCDVNDAAFRIEGPNASETTGIAP